jgi:serine/threonine protein kinase
VLPQALAGDSVRLARFEQEARAASALNHANIVTVYDTGWHDGLPFIVTELLEGEALDQRLARGPLPVREALECALHIAGGLVAAHERGIVHRDLKPANLFLTAHGQLKILDFGVAKLTHAGEEVNGSTLSGVLATMPGMVLGTVGYMSPEQVRAGPVDIRSDQFSLGCVLYELLIGQAPFRRPTAAQTMAAVLEDEPRPLAEIDVRVPRVVAQVVERCLAKDPGHRYTSTRDLARDLELAVSRLSEPPCPALAAATGVTSTVAPPLPPALAPLGLVLMIGAALLAAGVAAEVRALREGIAHVAPLAHRASQPWSSGLAARASLGIPRLIAATRRAVRL